MRVLFQLVTPGSNIFVITPLHIAMMVITLTRNILKIKWNLSLVLLEVQRVLRICQSWIINIIAFPSLTRLRWVITMSVQTLNDAAINIFITPPSVYKQLFRLSLLQIVWGVQSSRAQVLIAMTYLIPCYCSRQCKSVHHVDCTDQKTNHHRRLHTDQVAVWLSWPGRQWPDLGGGGDQSSGGEEDRLWQAEHHQHDPEGRQKFWRSLLVGGVPGLNDGAPVSGGKES